MAKKKEEAKIVLERTYNIPLRKEWLKVPKYKRAKKAVTALKQFLLKHMKATEVKIGKYLNLEIWKHGIKNPPHHVKVITTKDDKGLVKAELVGAPKEEVKEETKKKPAKKEEKPKAQEKTESIKKESIKKEEKTEVKEENKKAVSKEEKPIKKESTEKIK